MLTFLIDLAFVLAKAFDLDALLVLIRVFVELVWPCDQANENESTNDVANMSLFKRIPLSSEPAVFIVVEFNPNQKILQYQSLA